MAATGQRPNTPAWQQIGGHRGPGNSGNRAAGRPDSGHAEAAARGGGAGAGPAGETPAGGQAAAGASDERNNRDVGSPDIGYGADAEGQGGSPEGRGGEGGHPDAEAGAAGGRDAGRGGTDGDGGSHRRRTGREGEEDGPDRAHQRPDGLDDGTVQALGKLSEALETVERVRGHLYSAHQLVGKADFALDEAVSLFMQAGHTEMAERIQEELIGRNVIPGHWTFQIVEEFDDGYYTEFRAMEREARERLAGGRRHLYEAELKEQRRTRGRRGHESRPIDPRRHAG